MFRLEKRLLVSFIFAFIAVVGFASIAILISDRKIKAFDTEITKVVQSFTSPFLTRIMKAFTFIGSTPVVIIITLVVLLFTLFILKHRAEALLLFAVIAGTAILNGILKHLFHRVRPTIPHLVYASGYSFPSGHSMEAFALYGIIAFLLWRHAATPFKRTLLVVVCSFMILAIGISRIYLGVHFPSDVIGAYFVSAVWLILSIWVFQNYKERQYERKIGNHSDK